VALRSLSVSCSCALPLFPSAAVFGVVGFPSDLAIPADRLDRFCYAPHFHLHKIFLDRWMLGRLQFNSEKATPTERLGRKATGLALRDAC